MVTTPLVTTTLDDTIPGSNSLRDILANQLGMGGGTAGFNATLTGGTSITLSAGAIPISGPDTLDLSGLTGNALTVGGSGGTGALFSGSGALGVIGGKLTLVGDLSGFAGSYNLFGGTLDLHAATLGGGSKVSFSTASVLMLSSVQGSGGMTNAPVIGSPGPSAIIDFIDLPTNAPVPVGFFQAPAYNIQKFSTISGSDGASGTNVTINGSLLGDSVAGTATLSGTSQTLDPAFDLTAKNVTSLTVLMNLVTLTGSAPQTFTGAISGNSFITKTGAGTLGLTGDISGLTGVLRADTGSRLALSQSTINAGLQFDLTAGSAATLEASAAALSGHTVLGAGSGDLLDLKGAVSASLATSTVPGSSATLSGSVSGGGSYSIFLSAFNGSITSASDSAGGLNVSLAGAGGTVVTPPPASGGSGSVSAKTTVDFVSLSGGTATINLDNTVGSTSVMLPGSNTNLNLSNIAFMTAGASTPVALFAPASVTVVLPNALPDNGKPLQFVLSGGGNSVQGGSAPSHIFGGSGCDQISLGSGGGMVVGGSGTATINGGTAGMGFADPNHVVIFGATGGGMLTAGGNGSIVVGGGGSETLFGGAALLSPGSSALLVGSSIGGGSDMVFGNATAAASATLFVRGGAAAMTVAGGAEQDVIFGDSGALAVSGGSGSLIVAGGTGSTSVSAVAATQSITVFDGDGTLNVNASSSAAPLFVIGKASSTSGMSVAGGLGAAFITGNGGSDLIVLGPGGGTVVASAGGSTIAAGFGDALLYGGSGADLFEIQLVGTVTLPGALSETLALKPPSTIQIIGFQSGIDQLDLRNFGFTATSLPAAIQTSLTIGGVGGIAGLDIDLGTGQHLNLVGVASLAPTDLISAGLILSGTGTLFGSGAADSLTGLAGHATISAGLGADTIDIAAGAGSPGLDQDSVDAGGGNDLILASAGQLANNPFTIAGGAGIDTLAFTSAGSLVTPLSSGTILSGIELFEARASLYAYLTNAFVAAQGGSITVRAQPGSGAPLQVDSSSLTTGSLSIIGDSVSPASENISLGGGSQSIDGGAGDDILSGNAVNSSTAIVSGGSNAGASPVGDTIVLHSDNSSPGVSNVFTLGANLSHLESVSVQTGGAPTTIVNLTDAFVQAADPWGSRVTGGFVLVTAPSQTDALVINGGAVSATGHLLIDTASFDGNETVTGGAGDDLILGGLGGSSGTESLNGASGNDLIMAGLDLTTETATIRGGLGADTMTGGAATTTYIFSSGDTGITAPTADVITDFTPGTDKIDLTFFMFAATGVANIGTAPNGTAGEFGANAVLRYTGTGDLYIDASKDGKFGTGDLLIQLTGVPVVTMADFLFV